MLAIAASLVIVASVGTAGFIHGRALAVATAPPAAPAQVAAAETVHVVRFQLAAPGAHRVALVGDFNDWSRDAIVLQPAEKPGVWTASVPIKPGRHEYAFIVDGKRWVPDPYALTHTDEYNVKSSVIQVSSAGTE
jgi:1,4-alpha-glucan branching enzyme